jgi:ParB family chromosome partitioning protein
MMSTNRALRSAREAVDSHHVWELDPALIEDRRHSDRLDPRDVQELQASIEQNGQAVPILVRRHPVDGDRYLLVYGRRRLEAIRSSERVGKVRALIASLDDPMALRAQIAENTGRRDLSYIERALFARELLDSGYGTQAQVAEILNVTRSAMSMAVAVARAVGPALARAIGPAHGVGRPRWEALAREIGAGAADTGQLAEIALAARTRAAAAVQDDAEDGRPDPSLAAFDAVVRQLQKAGTRPRATTPRSAARKIVIAGRDAGTVTKTATGLRLEIRDVDDAFADWLERQAQDVVEELHARWKHGA